MCVENASVLMGLSRLRWRHARSRKALSGACVINRFTLYFEARPKKNPIFLNSSLSRGARRTETYKVWSRLSMDLYSRFARRFLAFEHDCVM